MSTERAEPLSDDSDTKRIIAQLSTGASAFDISQEALRLCRINVLLRADLKKAYAELRSSKQKQAVMDDALSEMRAELLPTQTLLDRVWQVVPEEDLRQDMKNRYAALRDGDPFDCKPTYRQSKSKAMRDARQSTKEQKRQHQGGKYTPIAGPSKMTSLLHIHNIEANDTKDSKRVNGDDDEEDDDGEGEAYKGNEGDKHGNVTDVNIIPSAGFLSSDAASTGFITGGKRKAVEQDGNVAAKVKFNSDSTTAGVVIARSVAGLKRKRAAETVNTALEKQNVGRVEGKEATSDNSDDDLEDGEIRE